jgi:hypothetical protein
MELRKASAVFTSWLSNELPPWAAYRALRSGRLVALDKSPGVRPVGIGEAWMRFDSKCVLSVAGGKAIDECGVDQLCAGLEAGVEGRRWDPCSASHLGTTCAGRGVGFPSG